MAPKARTTGDAQICFQEAEAFYKVACKCDDNNFNAEFDKTVPLAVNIALACELYFKSIAIMTKGTCIKDHSLDKLFLDLRDSEKQSIEEYWSKETTWHGLHDTLTTHDSLFVDWRYLFDKKKRNTIQVTDMGTLARVLHTVYENCVKQAGES